MDEEWREVAQLRMQVGAGSENAVLHCCLLGALVRVSDGNALHCCLLGGTAAHAVVSYGSAAPLSCCLVVLLSCCLVVLLSCCPAAAPVSHVGGASVVRVSESEREGVRVQGY